MLFPSVLGAEFAALDPCLKWVHSGESRGGRYHFFVDSELRGVGRIVRYEGLLDAAA